jgi:repressor LexA
MATGIEELTTRQAEIHRFLYASACETGMIPTVREIAQRFDIKSPNGVICHVKALIRKGYITSADLHSRGTRLLKTPDGEPIKGWRPITEE